VREHLGLTFARPVYAQCLNFTLKYWYNSCFGFSLKTIESLRQVSIEFETSLNATETGLISSEQYESLKTSTHVDSFWHTFELGRVFFFACDVHVLAEPAS
jgi:hypothetical protein